MVFVFASFTMVNANSGSEDKVESVRGCVDQALAYVQVIADENGDDLNGEWFDFYMATYMDQVSECMME